MQTETIALLFISLWVEVLITVLAFQNKYDSKEPEPKQLSDVKIDFRLLIEIGDIAKEKICTDDLKHDWEKGYWR